MHRCAFKNNACNFLDVLREMRSASRVSARPERPAQNFIGTYAVEEAPLVAHEIAHSTVVVLRVKSKGHVDPQQIESRLISKQTVVLRRHKQRSDVVINAITFKSIRNRVFCVLKYSCAISECFHVPQRNGREQRITLKLFVFCSYIGCCLAVIEERPVHCTASKMHGCYALHVLPRRPFIKATHHWRSAHTSTLYPSWRSYVKRKLSFWSDQH